MARAPAGEKRGRKVGIKDISREAQVSISTVSHVLNGTASISPAVRARVLEVAGRLGYLAHRQAKATITALDTILLAVPPDTLPQNNINFVSWTVLSALGRECERRGIRLLPFPLEGSAASAKAIVEAARSGGAQGIILLNVDRRETIDGIAAAGIPAAIINGEDSSMRLDSVTPGNRFAARLATDWLIRQGHRRILHMTWRGRATIRRRADGFADAFAENGLPVEDAVFCHAEGYEPRFGEKAIGEWLKANSGLGDVTAVFCAADNLALGVMRGLQVAGYRIPEDISVMGFDGVAPGEFTSPALTTVHVPLEQMGPAALQLIEQRVTSGIPDRASHRLELGCRLVIRNSVAPGPAAR
ncbi:LacI family transcriptional regulator [Devosia geojensis]|uniref:LacI family transcriptional regulator n=1 Tax=Devosia geojensis TaxID=443610 RepID=A0A0F5FSV8_9HYPH|nr:LacI family DNA-binding transcriptional regulator [Devosia geojensis]KKB11956.1 LacI family transcriptional regulator [Devosia geojensis]